MTTPALAAADAMAITRRNLIKYLRGPNLIVFSTVQPVMFVLLFAYVFGGAIRVPGVRYVDYLMPGIFAQTVAFGSINTGVGLAQDLGTGLIERFRSLPMARSAVLAGRTISDTVRNLAVVLLMVLVGTLIGFRIHTGVLPALVALGVALGFGFAMSWISATIGLVLRDVETAQSASFVWIFPLVFASSVFVPLRTMPGWLQSFARANPITNVANAIRALTLGGATTRPLLYALAWLSAILVTFAPLATRQYRKVA